MLLKNTVAINRYYNIQLLQLITAEVRMNATGWTWGQMMSIKLIQIYSAAGCIINIHTEVFIQQPNSAQLNTEILRFLHIRNHLSWHPSFIHIHTLCQFAKLVAVEYSKVKARSPPQIQPYLGWTKCIVGVCAVLNRENRETAEYLLFNSSSHYSEITKYKTKVLIESHVCNNCVLWGTYDCWTHRMVRAPLPHHHPPTQPASHVKWPHVKWRTFCAQTQRLHKYSIETNMFWSIHGRFRFYTSKA